MGANSLVPGNLTPFELRLLELRARGLDRNQIGHLLDRSPHTISNSLTIAKEKLGARTLLEAIMQVAALQAKPHARLPKGESPLDR